VGLRSVASSALNASQRETVGEAPVFDISVSSGGGSITSFDGASVSVALPYTLKSGQAPAGVVVMYVDASGSAEKLPTTYDSGSKKVSFKTSHLSLYAIGYEEPVISAPWVNPFLDVLERDWFYADVEYAYSKGLMTGISSTAFNPQGKMNRAMLVTILYRYATQTVGVPYAPSTNAFTDVPEGQWYSDAIAWAAANGIVNGDGDGRFAPEEYITREQLAAVLLRYAEYARAGPQGAWAVRLDFADVGSIDDWAVEGAMYCYKQGIITGKPGNLFDPDGEATRAEAATVLRRFIESL
jgi:hypothetical protein